MNGISTRRLYRLTAGCIAAGALALTGCASHAPPLSESVPDATQRRARMLTDMAELNDGPCAPGRQYVQQPLLEPVTIGPHGDTLETELVVRIRERCVPVWVQPPTPEGGDQPDGYWEMQTLELRTYGFPRAPGRPITEADADDPNSPNIAWSAPGPNFLVHPASAPGAADGTRIELRLYNRMPHDGDPHACDPILKCNTKGPDAGIDPATGECRVPPVQGPDTGGFPATVPHQVVDGEVVEPPNCFHGDNSTNFHFHGFHVSPQLGQDFVGLELRPPVPAGVGEAAMPAHGTHGESGVVAYGHFDFAVDPLRYTQPPGTHWYHAHKHGSTALQVLNGLVGTFEVRGEFDAALDDYFARAGGGALVDRLMVVQQLQERQPGLGGADQTGSVLINGQANPIVAMQRGEIQRWRFVGATMQASAALRVGFPETTGVESPEVRQIAMDGVQFSPDNYACQPFLNNPDCSPAADDSEFEELTAFALSPGNRVDLLVKAPDTPGTHCMVYDITTELNERAAEVIEDAHEDRADVVKGTCGIDPNTKLGPLFTLVVSDRQREMTFPSEDEFPRMAPYLANIPAVTDPALHRDIHYEMVNQGTLDTAQFWINQRKYDPSCANDTLILDQPQQWTLWNNSGNVAHPFHIHQNPFQLLSESDRTPNEYAYPVWRDTMAIPKAVIPQPTDPDAPKIAAVAPNSNPVENAWGNAEIRYVAKEFTGLFVNHCHILGHEDRGMMQNTQASCPGGGWATTGPVPPGAECDAEGFCPSDCATGEPIPATPACAAPPAQESDWPAAYGVPAG